MIAYLQGSGFLGTKAGLGADLLLLIMLAAAAMLTIGVVLARRRRHEPHRWVQTAAVCLNLVPVVAWMISSWFVVRTAGRARQQGHYLSHLPGRDVLHRCLMRRDRSPHFDDHELVRVISALQNLTRLAALRLSNERNNRLQEPVKTVGHAVLGFELVDSRNAH
jgi:hypothetical protein